MVAAITIIVLSCALIGLVARHRTVLRDLINETRRREAKEDELARCRGLLVETEIERDSMKNAFNTSQNMFSNFQISSKKVIIQLNEEIASIQDKYQKLKKKTSKKKVTNKTKARK